MASPPGLLMSSEMLVVEETKSETLEQKTSSLCEQRDFAISSTINHDDGITTDEFQHILQVALCDQVLAQKLCGLLERTSRRH